MTDITDLEYLIDILYLNIIYRKSLTVWRENMFSNPFSPIFGRKPDVFFGRERILNLFDHAMIDVGSDDRAIFITGTRGSGKTALLEQLSIRATVKKRKVIDLGPENTIEQLIYSLTGYDIMLAVAGLPYGYSENLG